MGEFELEMIQSQAEEIVLLREALSDRIQQQVKLHDEAYDVMKHQNAKLENLTLVIEQIIEICDIKITCDETAISGKGEVHELAKHYPELFAYLMAKLIETEY